MYGKRYHENMSVQLLAADYTCEESYTVSIIVADL